MPGAVAVQLLCGVRAWDVNFCDLLSCRGHTLISPAQLNLQL